MLSLGKLSGGGGAISANEYLGGGGDLSYTVASYDAGCSVVAPHDLSLLSSITSCNPCSAGWKYSTTTGACDIPDCTLASNCNNHGTCKFDTSVSSVPYCNCSSLWLGTACDVKNCPGTPDCNSKGLCDIDIATGDPTCYCNQNYLGNDCSIPICPGFPDNMCNNRGYCSDTNGAPECICTTPGYTGSACETYVQPPPINDTNSTPNSTSSTTLLYCPGVPECFNHGTCDRSTGKCQCNSNFKGASCKERNCPDNCGNRGNCLGITDTYSFCNCSIGWSGDNCSIVLDEYCPKNCSGYACNKENVPFCICDQVHTGKGCEDQIHVNNAKSDISWYLYAIIGGGAVLFVAFTVGIVGFCKRQVRYGKKVSSMISKLESSQNQATNSGMSQNV